MTVGERIRDRRKQLGLSAEYIAERLDCSPATIYRYENGYIEKMPIDSILPIAKILLVSPAYLMGWEDESGVQGVQNVADGLSRDESKLIDTYRSVTEQGQQEMMAHADYIGERYKKNPSASADKAM